MPKKNPAMNATIKTDAREYFTTFFLEGQVTNFISLLICLKKPSLFLFSFLVFFAILNLGDIHGSSRYNL